MRKYNLRNKIVTLAPNLVVSDNSGEELKTDRINLPALIESNEIYSEANELISETEDEMTTFSEEQFRQILAAMGGSHRGGSFTRCTARYKGQRDPAAVDEFLAAISVYKDIEKISDADALRGMPLLLEDYAATWWIGVKDTVSTFEDAKTLIRATFSPTVPDWRTFATIYEGKQQKKEPTDSFICKKRLLFSQLKLPINEEVQINMIYGLLHVNIRERLIRDKLTTFGELITASREVEMCLTERAPATMNVHVIKEETTNSIRCCFCRIKGHTIDKCLKKKKRDEQLQQNNQQRENSNLNRNEHTSQPIALQQNVMKRPTFSCYGCGTPGVYRANCPTCSAHAKESPQYLSFNTLSSVIGHPLPTTTIGICGLSGEAVFDSGAKTSIASRNLKTILTRNGCVFQDVTADVVLADGSITTGTVMSTICEIRIGNRIRKIRFIYLPKSKNNRTLLGMDFLDQAGIVLNIPQRYWHFDDEPKTRFNFTNPLEMALHTLDISGHEDSPCTKMVNEVSSFVKFMEGDHIVSPIPPTPEMSTLRHNGDVYSPHSIQEVFAGSLPVGSKTPEQRSTLFASPLPVGKSSEDVALMKPSTSKQTIDYSPHSVQSIFKDALPSGQMTPRETSTLFAPPAKCRRTEQDEYLDSVFLPIFSIDIKVLKDSDGVGLNELQRTQLDKLLMSNDDIFTEPLDATPYAVHRIHTQDHDTLLGQFYSRGRVPTNTLVGALDESVQPMRMLRRRGRPRK